MLEGACSLQGCFWCFQIEITDTLSSNWTEWNFLDMEDQICFRGNIKPVYDRGCARTESSGRHLRCSESLPDLQLML